MNNFLLEIISAEKKLFSGKVVKAHFTGEHGELEVLANHTPLLTCLKPGLIRYQTPEGNEDIFYASGGFLEVQPHQVLVLADTTERADELDEALIEASLHDQRNQLNNSEIEYSKALSQLAELSAKIRLIKQIRKVKK
ncbi:MAG: ATP synthase F1 subunit epsilon [Gammaproteobacteria bacterium]|jgi:F-type H+-transporting ATPase subunit epsilon|nr:ATP synthase F1 subunit epsilon [Gammaproteobacteria bacterium]